MQRFLRSHYKSALQSKRQGHKLYSKVLTIEPNRLLKKSRTSTKLNQDFSLLVIKYDNLIIRNTIIEDVEI